MHEPSAINIDFYPSVETMGHVAFQSFGRRMYTIGFTADEGKAGDAMGRPDSPTEDVRGWIARGLVVPPRAPVRVCGFAEPLRGDRLASSADLHFLQYEPIKNDWTRQFDGVVFTHTMFPSTKRPMAPDGAVLSER